MQMIYSIHALESYMLFGIDPATAAGFRHARQQYLEQADTSMEKLREYAEETSLGYDATRIREIDAGLRSLKDLEEKIEQLNESKTSQGTSQAYDLFQNQMLPLEKSLFALTGDLGESQMKQANLEIAQLQRANSSTLWTLWIATVLGALAGGSFSFVLSRRITRSI